MRWTRAAAASDSPSQTTPEVEFSDRRWQASSSRFEILLIQHRGTGLGLDDDRVRDQLKLDLIAPAKGISQIPERTIELRKG